MEKYMAISEYYWTYLDNFDRFRKEKGVDYISPEEVEGRTQEELGYPNLVSDVDNTMIIEWKDARTIYGRNYEELVKLHKEGNKEAFVQVFKNQIIEDSEKDEEE